MKQQKSFFIDDIFAGFFLSIALVWLFEENHKRKKRIELLEREMENGLYLDKLNLERDWRNINADINHSYEKLLEENSL